MICWSSAEASVAWSLCFSHCARCALAALFLPHLHHMCRPPAFTSPPLSAHGSLLCVANGPCPSPHWFRLEPITRISPRRSFSLCLLVFFFSLSLATRLSRSSLFLCLLCTLCWHVAPSLLCFSFCFCWPLVLFSFGLLGCFWLFSFPPPPFLFACVRVGVPGLSLSAYSLRIFTMVVFCSPVCAVRVCVCRGVGGCLCALLFRLETGEERRGNAYVAGDEDALFLIRPSLRTSKSISRPPFVVSPLPSFTWPPSVYIRSADRVNEGQIKREVREELLRFPVSSLQSRR